MESTSRIEGPQAARIYRVLDANFNRAGEGLRVLEEFARFVLDDVHLTEQWKQLRHELLEISKGPHWDNLLRSRDVVGDVGAEITTDDEYERSDARAVAAASQKRVEQSLRCLEEYSKPLWPQAAPRIERLRYRAYTIGAAMQTVTGAQQQLQGMNVYALVGTGSVHATVSHCQNLLQAGVRMLQLREKRLDDRQLLETARQLVSLTRPVGALLIVNDRPDIAHLANADGVHLGQDDLRFVDARAVVGPRMLIGVSTHTLEQAREAARHGADYIGCGPTFTSSTKDFDELAGPELLRQVAAEIRLPAFAIGGIHGGNVSEVREAGFERIAVSGALGPDADLPATLAQLESVLSASSQ